MYFSDGGLENKGGDYMPSDSIAQQQATAIAEHEPEKLYKRNKGLLKMTKGQLHDFASTKHKGLPKHKGGWLKRHKSKRKGE